MRLIEALIVLARLRAFRYTIKAGMCLAELATWIGPGASGKPR